MKNIRWASGSTLAIALVFLGCGGSSTTTKDGSVANLDTGSVGADSSGAASDSGGASRGAGDMLVMEGGGRDGAMEKSIPSEVGPALDLGGADGPATPDAPTDAPTGGQDSSVDRASSPATGTTGPGSGGQGGELDASGADAPSSTDDASGRSFDVGGEAGSANQVPAWVSGVIDPIFAIARGGDVSEAPASDVALAWVEDDAIRALETYWAGLAHSGIVSDSTFDFANGNGGYFATDLGTVALFVARNTLAEQDSQIVRAKIANGTPVTWLEYWSSDAYPMLTLVFATADGVHAATLEQLLLWKEQLDGPVAYEINHPNTQCNNTIDNVCTALAATLGTRAQFLCSLRTAATLLQYTSIVCAPFVTAYGIGLPICSAVLAGAVGTGLCLWLKDAVPDTLKTGCQAGLGCALKYMVGIPDCSCLDFASAACSAQCSDIVEGALCKWIDKKVRIQTSRTYATQVTNVFCRAVADSGPKGPLNAGGKLCKDVLANMCEETAGALGVDAACDHFCTLLTAPFQPKAQGVASGDPHLCTLDGVRYDAQPKGEVTLIHDDADGLEVQLRTQPWPQRNVAINSAVAARVGADKVGFYLDGSTYLDSAPLTFNSGEVQLPDGGRVWRDGSAYAVIWPDNTQLRLDVHSSYIDVRMYVADARRGHVVGLLGNFNGDTTDEFTTRQGKTIPAPLGFESFYGEYAESWRVTDSTSLFDYQPGQSTATFTDRSFPKDLMTVAGLSPADLATATSACSMVREEWRDACILDFAQTADSALLTAFVGTPVPQANVGINAQTAMQHYWTDWTSATTGTPGSASGTITLPGGHQVAVTYSGEVYGAQVSGGTNYWSPATAYTSNNLVANAPPAADIIRLVGGNSVVNTITFSEPVTNPVMAIVGMGQTGVTVTYNFGVDFNVIGYGQGYFGNGTLTKLDGNILQGNEGHGVIEFRGTFTKISWTVPTAENWHGFQIGMHLLSGAGSANMCEGGDAIAWWDWCSEGSIAGDSCQSVEDPSKLCFICSGAEAIEGVPGVGTWDCGGERLIISSAGFYDSVNGPDWSDGCWSAERSVFVGINWNNSVNKNYVFDASFVVQDGGSTAVLSWSSCLLGTTDLQCPHAPEISGSKTCQRL